MTNKVEKLTPEFIKQAILDAVQLASEATQKYLNSVGGDSYPCGFAWVNIKPARGPWVKVLKEMKFGRPDTYNGGYTIWNPSGNFCQNVDAKIAGAKAFSEAMAKHGVTFNVGSRWD